MSCIVLFGAEEVIRDPLWSRGIGDVYKGKLYLFLNMGGGQVLFPNGGEVLMGHISANDAKRFVWYFFFWEISSWLEYHCSTLGRQGLYLFLNMHGDTVFFPNGAAVLRSHISANDAKRFVWYFFFWEISSWLEYHCSTFGRPGLYFFLNTHCPLYTTVAASATPFF